MNRTWVEIAEADWTEENRAYTRSVSLDGAIRSKAGNVVVDLDLGDREPLPAAVKAVALVRRTHAEQLATTRHENLSSMPSEHLRFVAKIVAVPLWSTKTAGDLVTDIMDRSFRSWSVVETPTKRTG